MRNKNIKILFTVLILIFIVFSMTNTVLADNFDFTKFDTQANNSNTNADQTARNIIGTGIQTIKIVGYGVSIIMLTYIGIKYMTAAPSEKADLKKSLMIFVVGAVLVFGATIILDLITNFASSNGLAPSQATAAITMKGE